MVIFPYPKTPNVTVLRCYGVKTALYFANEFLNVSLKSKSYDWIISLFYHVGRLRNPRERLCCFT